MSRRLWWSLRVAFALVTAACEAPPDPRLPVPPADFPPLPVPADNPLAPAAIALGRTLFFDPILSRTNDVACASCHRQQHGFADPRALSVGVEGRTGTRNAPALANLAWVTTFFWDGGVDSLERQALAPIKDPNEMDLPISVAVERLAQRPDYDAAFRAAFGTPPTELALTQALASFVRSLVSGDSRWDRHRGGDAGALTAAEARGRALFFGEGGECFHCHDGVLLSNNRFANNGTYLPGGDLGRQRVTQRPIDLGRFRVPSLRNVAVTAPYMHDGSIATLEDVVEHYARGGRGHESTDPVIQPLALDAEAKRDLVAFLRALTDEAFLRDPRHRP